MCCRSFTAVALLGVGFCNSVTFGDNPEFAFDIRKDVLVKALVNGSYSLTVDVGVLPSGAKGSLVLRLINQDELNFPVKDVIASCSCATGTLSVDDIKPVSSAELMLIINTPRTSKTIESSVLVKINSKTHESRNISVVVRYQLGELMCFVDEMVVKELAPGEGRLVFNVPFLLTKPLQSADVFLLFSPATPGVFASLTEIEGECFVRVEVDPIAVVGEGTRLTLGAQIPDRGLYDELIVSLARHREVEISPRTLHFRRVDEKITAQCILRVNGIAGNNPIDISLPSVEATIDGQLLSVQTTKLGNGVFLIKLSEKESQAIQQLGRDDEQSIQWRILTSSKAFDIRSKAKYEPSTIDVPVETP